MAVGTIATGFGIARILAAPTRQGDGFNILVSATALAAIIAVAGALLFERAARMGQQRPQAGSQVSTS